MVYLGRWVWIWGRNYDAKARSHNQTTPHSGVQNHLALRLPIFRPDEPGHLNAGHSPSWRTDLDLRVPAK
jgi:hypothetical protein